jgi:hypothetical protein
MANGSEKYVAYRHREDENERKESLDSAIGLAPPFPAATSGSQAPQPEPYHTVTQHLCPSSPESLYDTYSSLST